MPRPSHRRHLRHINHQKATLAGEDREATTHIAGWLSEQVLDDGNYAAGVRAHSKYGGGICWAYWMQRKDDALGTDPVTAGRNRNPPQTRTWTTS